MSYIFELLYVCVIAFTLIKTHIELQQDTTYELDTYERHLINIAANVILSTQKLIKLLNSFIFIIGVTIIYINISYYV
jgi:hypothetical protein